MHYSMHAMSTYIFIPYITTIIIINEMMFKKVMQWDFW